MKKSFHLSLLLIAVVLLASCETTSTTVDYPEQLKSQEKVFRFLQEQKKGLYSCGNKLQEEQFIKEYEQRFYTVLDTLKPLVGWSGTIDNISKTEAKDGTIVLKFVITCRINPKENNTLELECQHILSKNELETDKIYNTVFQLRNNQKVVFDGFPRTNSDKTLNWHSYTSPSLKVSYPDIDFWVTDIKSQPSATLSDTLSTNLYNACKTALDFYDLPIRKWRKEITTKEYNTKSKELQTAIEEAKTILTEEENDYLTRLCHDAFFNAGLSK